MAALRQYLSKEVYEESVQLVLDTVRQQTMRHGGHEIFQGYQEDCLMDLVFKDCRSGLRSALAIQEALVKLTWHDQVCGSAASAIHWNRAGCATWGLPSGGGRRDGESGGSRYIDFRYLWSADFFSTRRRQ